MKFVLASLLVSVFAILSAYTVEAEIKIATVDISRILNESSEAKAHKEELDQASEKARRVITSKREQLVEREEELKGKGVAENSPEVKKLQQDAKDFSRYVRDTEEELREKFMKFNRSLTVKAMKAVEEYARQQKIDLVFDKSSGERGPLLYGVVEADITEAIIKKFR
jgi:Skp family chaperone for outer membrane proteins